MARRGALRGSGLIAKLRQTLQTRTNHPEQSHPRVLGPLLSLWRYRELVAQLTWRDVLQRYRGSAFGLLWAVITPIFMLSIYTFVFGVVLKARWQERADTIVEATGAQGLAQFAIIIYCGLSIFEIFSISVNRAVGSIYSNPNYVKKVVFPLHILPISIFLSTLIHGAINLLILTALSFMTFDCAHWPVVFLPLLLVSLSLLTLGVSMIVAAMGVFFRDLSIGVGLLLQILFFASPVFYSVNLIPKRLEWMIFLMRLNPLTTMIEESRRMVVWGQTPDWTRIGVTTLVSLAVFLAGFSFFSRCKRYFADAI